MKRGELFTLHTLCLELRERASTKLVYAILKNLPKIDAEIEVIKTADQPTETFMAFDEARVQLCVKFAKKTDDGQPVIVDNTFDIEDMPAFEVAIQELQAVHAEAVKERDAQITEVQRLLSEEVNLDLYQISVDDLPGDLVATQLEVLMPMIKQ